MKLQKERNNGKNGGVVKFRRYGGGEHSGSSLVTMLSVEVMMALVVLVVMINYSSALQTESEFELESRKRNQTQITSNQHASRNPKRPKQIPLKQLQSQQPKTKKLAYDDNQTKFHCIKLEERKIKKFQKNNQNHFQTQPQRAKRNIILSNNNNNNDDNQVTRTIEYSLYEELKTPLKLGNLKKDARISNPDQGTPPISLKFHFRVPSSAKRSNDIDFFWLNESSSDLYVTRKLDRDTLCGENHSNHQRSTATISPSHTFPSICVISFDVIVMPTSRFHIIKTTINLMDINDNSPRFERTSTQVFISESSPVGALFPLPAAEDDDAGLFAVQDYSLISQSSNFELQVTDQADGSTDVRLKLTSALDRERKDYYEATLVAMDGGRPPRSASMLLKISVLDANDHTPHFSKPFYQATLPENAPTSTQITTVTATDEDLGVNGKISYSLAAASLKAYGDVFGVDSQSGLVYLKRELDYEHLKRYKLMVVAANEEAFETVLSSTALVEVVIDDVNDNAPVISVNNLTPSGQAEVLENVPEGMFVAHVVVNDADSTAGGEVTCSLIGQSDFALVELFRHEYKVITKKVFDREKQNHYELSLSCRDDGSPPLESIELLNVTILDVNEHHPYFGKPIYHASVSEAATTHFQVTKFSARDDDSGDKSLFLYRLEGVDNEFTSSNDEANFVIGDQSGLVTVNGSLDYERRKKYVYKVVVADDPSNPLTATTTLVIEVEDENDSVPVFDHMGGYNFRVKENKKQGTLVGVVSARDADLSEKFKKVSYALEKKNSLFTIDEMSGELKLLKKLDRERRERHHMVVKAGNVDAHGLFIEELVSKSNVTVTVVDVNDNHPVFLFPNSSHHQVHIDMKRATEVGSAVVECMAFDADTGDNAEVKYSIVQGNLEHGFEIESENGLVYVAKNLLELVKNSSEALNVSLNDYSIYNLVIKAEDSGRPSLSSTQVVSIHFNYTPPFYAVTKEKGFSRLDGLFAYMPFFLMVIASIVGCVVVGGCLYCSMFLFCKFSKKHKVSRALRDNKLYLVEKYNSSSESLERMSTKPGKINSVKSLNAWPGTEGQKVKSATRNNMATVTNRNSMTARRSMPNLRRGSYSKSSYDRGLCHCHVHSLKAVNQMSTVDSSITMTTNTPTKSTAFEECDKTKTEVKKEKEKEEKSCDDNNPDHVMNPFEKDLEISVNTPSQPRERKFPQEHQSSMSHCNLRRGRALPRHSTLQHVSSNLSHHPPTSSSFSSTFTNTQSVFMHSSASLPRSRRGARSEGSGGESDSTCSCSDSGRGLSEDERVKHRRGLRSRGSLRSAWIHMSLYNKQNEILFRKSAINKQQQQHLLPPPPQKKSNLQKPLQVSFRLSPLKTSFEHQLSPSPPALSAYQVYPAPVLQVTATLKPSQPPQQQFEPSTDLSVVKSQSQQLFHQIPQQYSQTQQLKPQCQSPLQLPQQPLLKQSQNLQKTLPQPQQHNLLNFKIPPQNQLLNLATTRCNIPATENKWHKTIANATSEV